MASKINRTISRGCEEVPKVHLHRGRCLGSSAANHLPGADRSNLSGIPSHYSNRATVLKGLQRPKDSRKAPGQAYQERFTSKNHTTLFGMILTVANCYLPHFTRPVHDQLYESPAPSGSLLDCANL